MKSLAKVVSENFESVHKNLRKALKLRVKRDNMKRQTLLAVLGMVIMMGCTMGTGTPTAQTQADEVGTVVAATMQSYTALPSEAASPPGPTQISGTPVSFENVSFVIPEGLASDAIPEAVSAVNGAPWESAPAHVKIALTGYTLQGKFHQPAIYFYPADEYKLVNPNSTEQIDRIQKILAGSTILKETLPSIPWFNAQPMIAAQIKIVPFQNGGGVRALTEYAQYYAPINNNELFYHFEGLTKDNQYYIIAVLPITAPILPENEKPDAPVPEGGVSIPTDIGVNNTYYITVTEKLNSIAPQAYSPSLNTLDALIQSVTIKTP